MAVIPAQTAVTTIEVTWVTDTQTRMVTTTATNIMPSSGGLLCPEELSLFPLPRLLGQVKIGAAAKETALGGVALFQVPGLTLGPAIHYQAFC
jgi:hypothetical protein